MSSPVDPNDVMMTGENSFVRLSHDGGKTLADRWSHWRVLWCPAGAGHVLLVQAELTGGKPRIYSDNIAMTRWLQKAIESMLFPPTADPSIPVVEASFERSGDPRAAATERIVSASDEIVMTWYDFNDPFVLTIGCGKRVVCRQPCPDAGERRNSKEQHDQVTLHRGFLLTERQPTIRS